MTNITTKSGLVLDLDTVSALGDAILDHVLDRFDGAFDEFLPADKFDQSSVDEGRETEDQFMDRYEEALGEVQYLVIRSIFGSDPDLDTALATAIAEAKANR